MGGVGDEDVVICLLVHKVCADRISCRGCGVTEDHTHIGMDWREC